MRPIPQARDLWKRAIVGERVGRVSSHAVSRRSWPPGCCGFRGVFSVGRIFSCLFFGLFFFQAEDGIRDQPRSRGLGDVYKRQ